MPKTRLLILQTHAKSGGTQELARLLSGGLCARGYEVLELYLVRDSDFLREDPGIIPHSLPPTHGPLGYPRMAMLAWSQMHRLKPDVVLCMQWGANLLGGWGARFAGSPVMISSQFDSPTQMPRWPRWLDRLQGTSGVFSRIVVNSRTVENSFAQYPAPYRQRLACIEHGIAPRTSALSKAQARQSFGLPQNATLLGSVGRLVPGKNLSAAIKLLAHNAQWHLALGGHGPDADRLRQYATMLGCADRLHMCAEISPDRVGDFLAGLDVFVFPSRAETFGLAVAEAAAAGVPVVANDLPVLREVLAVEGEACALFVDADDEQVFAAGVERILQDEILRGRLTALAPGLKKRFSLHKMYDDYDRLIQAALADR